MPNFGDWEVNVGPWYCLTESMGSCVQADSTVLEGCSTFRKQIFAGDSAPLGVVGVET